MYGFESTVLLALLSGNAFSAERPFYPADIAAAIAAVPQPRALVTTPVHLRALLASAIDLPPLDLIVSATAPLGQEPGARSGSEVSHHADGNLRLHGNRTDRHAPHRRLRPRGACGPAFG